MMNRFRFKALRAPFIFVGEFQMRAPSGRVSRGFGYFPFPLRPFGKIGEILLIEHVRSCY